jgi:hypothetical protein
MSARSGMKARVKIMARDVGFVTSMGYPDTSLKINYPGISWNKLEYGLSRRARMLDARCWIADVKRRCLQHPASINLHLAVFIGRSYQTAGRNF